MTEQYESPPGFNEDDFFEDEDKPMESMDMDAFERLCNQVFDMDTEIKAEEAAIKEKKKELDGLKSKVLFIMQKYKKQNTNCAAGMIYQIESTSVPLPQGDEKKKFFDYLKNKGIFEDVVHMNSRTFNSFYKAERDAALEEGNVDWQMPGVGEEMVIHKIGMRRGKK